VRKELLQMKKGTSATVCGRTAAGGAEARHGKVLLYLVIITHHPEFCAFCLGLSMDSNARSLGGIPGALSRRVADKTCGAVKDSTSFFRSVL
jgi:hypothetical protein